jgi:hypothetical protein
MENYWGTSKCIDSTEPREGRKPQQNKPAFHKLQPKNGEDKVHSVTSGSHQLQLTCYRRFLLFARQIPLYDHGSKLFCYLRKSWWNSNLSYSFRNILAKLSGIPWSFYENFELFCRTTTFKEFLLKGLLLLPIIIF